MPEPDAINEILEFAISREVEANEFYTALADKVSNSAMSRLLKDLAEEELEHKTKLELEVMKIGDVVKQAPRSPDADETARLKISNYIVEDGGQFDMEYEDLLLLGIKKEKASFRLYIDLAEMIDDKQVHETLLEIAEEEARHKMRFEIEYDNLLQRRQHR